MSHHGHEDEMERFHAEHDRKQLPISQAKLTSAIKLIQAIAADAGSSENATCDAWLEKNGYECEASRRRQRERRAEQLDAEIARLRSEREKL